MIDKPSTIKQKIMLKLAQDKNMRNYIGDVQIEYPEDLIGKSIFPYLKVDGTVQESKVCIGISANFPNINEKNNRFKNATITILILCENGFLNTNNGYCRTDLISERICELLNWNDIFGFRLNLISDKESPLDERFYTRELVFKTVTNNNTLNGSIINK